MSGRSYRKAAGGVPESAREPVSGMPSWACGPADPNIPPGEGVEFGQVRVRVSTGAHAVDGAHVEGLRDGGVARLHAPHGLAQRAHRRRRVEHDLGAVQPEPLRRPRQPVGLSTLSVYVGGRAVGMMRW